MNGNQHCVFLGRATPQQKYKRICVEMLILTDDFIPNILNLWKKK